MSKYAVEFANVSKTYGKSYAVRDLNLKIEYGKLVTFIGPSGCGKTTSLKMINRLIEPTSGQIYVEGTDISTVDPVHLRRDIGYVIQQIGLFPFMTIEDNITLVPRLKGKKKADLLRKTEELLDLIGLDPAQFRHRYPFELSGGQQQRVGVARALAAEPSIVLMDEPFSALDPISREQLQDELVKLQTAVHKTIVFVTHDMDEALKIADHIVVMRDGSVVQEATPDQLLRRPADDFVRDFIGEKRFQRPSMMVHAADVMTTPVTIRPNQGLAEAIDLMRRRRVNGLMITDSSGRYLGVVGPHEIYDNFGHEHAVVGELMQTDVPLVRADTDIQTVFSLLDTNTLGFVPVVDPREHLVGVVTRASVIRIVATSYQKEDIVDERPNSSPVAAGE